MFDQMMQAARPSGYPSSGHDNEMEPFSETRAFAFGHFLAFPAARMLTCKGTRVDLGSRAFDILMVLLRSQGRVVLRSEILRQVWPSMIVDEGNLRFQMTNLRKALGDERDRIKTVTGRGYLFVADQTKGEPVATPLFKSVSNSGVSHPARRAAIVIIDANPDNREALSRLLKPLDAQVQSFSSIDDFLQSSRGLRPADLPRV